MKNELQHYELTFIIPGSLPEDEHPKIIDKINSLLQQNEAQITSQEDMGKKKFTYPIKHLRHGFYKTMTFDLEPQKLKEIEKELMLDQNILRFLTIKSHQKTKEDIAKEEKVKAKRVKEKIAERTKQVEEKKEEKKEKTKKPKISLEDLDKKLDELLDDEVI